MATITINPKAESRNRLFGVSDERAGELIDMIADACQCSYDDVGEITDEGTFLKEVLVPVLAPLTDMQEIVYVTFLLTLGIYTDMKEQIDCDIFAG